MRASEEISTRTLVMTMVGEDGRLDAGGLYEVAEACGMSDQQVRLCLRRMLGEGAIEHLGGRGRKGAFRLAGGAGAAELPELELVGFAYEQDAGREPWDGAWRLISFTLDQERRGVRDELRTRLLFLGAAQLQAGIYVSANPWEELVDAEAERLGVTGDLLKCTTRQLVVGGEADPARIAAAAWPLAPLAASYEEFIVAVEQRLEAVGESPSEVIRAAARTVVDFARIMGGDPLLPPELLPARWPGHRARSLMTRAGEEFERRAGPMLPPAFRRLTALGSALPSS